MKRNEGPIADGEILNFESAREERIEEKRRNYERVLFRSVLGVYTVMEQKGLHAIELLDISEGGLSFQVALNSDFDLKEGDNLTLRLYFATDSYLPVSVKVVRVVDAIEEGVKVRQYGCLIDTDLASYEAVFHFVQFIAKCAEHGHEDNDHLKIFY